MDRRKNDLLVAMLFRRRAAEYDAVLLRLLMSDDEWCLKYLHLETHDMRDCDTTRHHVSWCLNNVSGNHAENTGSTVHGPHILSTRTGVMNSKTPHSKMASSAEVMMSCMCLRAARGSPHNRKMAAKVQTIETRGVHL